jgi:hypothetical protein
MMLSMPPVDVIGLLPGYLVLPWVRSPIFLYTPPELPTQIRYVQEWTRVHQTVALKFRHQNGTNYHFNGQSCNANSWWEYCFTCIERLAPGVHTLQSLDDVFHYDIPVYNNYEYNEPSRECCRADLQAWRKRIEDAIAEIPKFHTFL